MAKNPYELKHLPISQRNRHEADPVRSARQLTGVVPGSPAEALGIRAGDELLKINGRKIRDVFDYRLAVLDDVLELTLRRLDGSIYERRLEKGENQDPGLEFAESMMDDPLHCHNKCLFCFIDQLPPGMREMLYFKDDDMRLSFLTGNYITLTNMKDEELDRLIAYHLSPMNVSVHATDPELRKYMLGNRFAVRIMDQLRRIAEAGIEINVQIVLMPGLNDGEALEQTLRDLSALGPSLQSIACVPVGLTKYRKALGLPYIKPVDKASAADLLARTARWQAAFKEKLGRRVFFPADEFYLMAGEPIPEAEAYEGFPQLENGIGLLSLFRAEMKAIVRSIYRENRRNKDFRAFRQKGLLKVHMPTGTAAAEFMRPYCRQLGRSLGVELIVHAVENKFFGESITVAGLLTGQDLYAALKEILPPEPEAGEIVMIGDVMLRSGEEVFLDDWTVDELQDKLGVPVLVNRSTAEGIREALERGKDLLL